MDLTLFNLTPFAAESAISEPGQPVSGAVIKATFKISSKPGIQPADEQLGFAGVDQYVGDPEITAIRYESDFVPFKPRADALCVGKAYTPGGVPASECVVGFGVGSWFKTIRVVGNRRWRPVLGGLLHRMSKPEPFKTMVVSYENSFGGRDAGKPDGYRFYSANPIGKGYSRRGRGLKGLPLPNLEDPKGRIRSWRSRPRPMSFGPVGRTWEPRIKKAGTYDKRWLKERSPKLPEDFDEAYYNCVPEDQQIQGYLRGDEVVRVVNMHPEHADFRFRLPGIRVRALLDKRAGGQNQFEEVRMNLDTLWVDMEALQLVLVWRGRFATPGAGAAATVIVVEEPLGSTPRPAESYRPELAKHMAEEQEADRAIEEAEKELEQRLSTLQPSE